MWTEAEERAIEAIWRRKLEQDASGVDFSGRHRNLEPASARLLTALVAGVGARRVLEIGGSSGLSTIALAAGVRQTDGRVTSLEIEPERRALAEQTLSDLGLLEWVDLRLGDAADILPGLGEMDLVLIDCEKEDYCRFFDLLRMVPGGLVVADNILSHDLGEYVAHVRSLEGVESMTLPVGKGLEVTRFAALEPVRS